MKTILILAVSALCVFSAKADDDYATIVRYLGENGYYIISPDQVAKVRAFMKANGYQHVSEIPKSAAAAFDSVAEPHATEAVQSAESVTHIVVPSATPSEKATLLPNGQYKTDAELTYDALVRANAQHIDNNYLEKEYHRARIVNGGEPGVWTSSPTQVQLALGQAWEDLMFQQTDIQDRYEILIKRAFSQEEKNRLEQEKSIKLKAIQDQMDEITLKRTENH
jgi:hypothetical protein